MQSGTARQRSSSQQGTQAAQPSRKIFNCIVDDTALVAGVKRSTRNGLRHWVKHGQIRLFVPLHALEQLSQQRSASHRHADDVRETLDWLDHATTKFPNTVTLQGGDETFLLWSDVEKFAVPRSLFSEHDHVDSHTFPSLEESAAKITLSDANHRNSISSNATDSAGSRAPSTLESARSSMSAVSPPTSPSKAPLSPTTQYVAFDADASSDLASNGVPVRLQPLFNYILWRIHQEIDPVAALESFIFLCNDPSKANLAKGFEVRCKRLEQLRDAIGREEREFRNRQIVQSRETQSFAVQPPDAASNQAEPKSPPVAPAAMMQTQAKIIDPDAFERSTDSPRAAKAKPQDVRGGSITAQRSNAAPSRGRGRGNINNGVRGGFPLSSNRSRGAPPGHQFDNIDPNSFERPRGGQAGRGGRRLWSPT